MSIRELLEGKQPIATYSEGKLSWNLDRDINAVYLIKFGDDFYIGSSIYLYTRIQQHLSSLRKGCHFSTKMQSLFNQRESFDVYSLERGIASTELVEVEKKYIGIYRPTLNSNIPPMSTSFNRIESIIKNNGETITSLACRLGVTPLNLSKMLADPTISTLEDIANILGLQNWNTLVAPLSPQTTLLRCPHCHKLVPITLCATQTGTRDLSTYTDTSFSPDISYSDSSSTLKCPHCSNPIHLRADK